MLTKCICILLVLAVAQAFPSSDVKPTNDEPTCSQKVAWYMGISEKLKSMYSEYQSISRVDLLTSLTADAVSKLTVDETNFLNLTRSFVLKISIGPDNSTRNDANEQSPCDIDSYRMATLNFTQSAIIYKANVSNVIDHSKLPNEAKDIFNKSLAKIVNFLIEIDMTENDFKDLEALAKEAETKATQGIQLDKQYEVTENGVDEKMSWPDLDDLEGLQENELVGWKEHEREKQAEREREERAQREERRESAETVDYHVGENRRMPIRSRRARNLAAAFAHPAVFLTVVGVVFVVICGVVIRVLVRPDEQVGSRYTQMP